MHIQLGLKGVELVILHLWQQSSFPIVFEVLFQSCQKWGVLTVENHRFSFLYFQIQQYRFIPFSGSSKQMMSFPYQIIIILAGFCQIQWQPISHTTYSNHFTKHSQQKVGNSYPQLAFVINSMMVIPAIRIQHASIHDQIGMSVICTWLLSSFL